MSDQNFGVEFVYADLTSELWHKLRKYSGFFEGQASCLLAAGKPLPCKYQFGVFGGFRTAQAALYNLQEDGIQGYHGPGWQEGFKWQREVKKQLCKKIYFIGCPITIFSVFCTGHSLSSAGFFPPPLLYCCWSIC